MTIDEAIKTYGISNAEYERTHGNLQGYLEFKQLSEWLEELKELREQTRWIPTDERQPEESGKYLVSVMDPAMDDCYTENAWYAHPEDYDIEEGEWRELMIGEEVIAWRLSPEPYRTEKEKKEEQGRWIHNKCDKCGASRPPLFDNYCPNCGTKMQEQAKTRD